MGQGAKIVIIEDEEAISRIINDYLGMNGYEIRIAEDGESGLLAIEQWAPDFIILDITLPGADGIELCRQIRGICNTPILILSARTSDTDKVLGLGFGADDYMTKPFSLSELAARVNAHLRRSRSLQSAQPAAASAGALQFGGLVIDKLSYKVTMDGREISLSAKEFELLHHMARHVNQVFSKSQLLDAVWGYDAYGDENTITVYMRRLREKLEADPSHPLFIKTVWGIGYKFSSE